MSEASSSAPIMENEHVKEFLSILQENGKDSMGLSALLGYVSSMENQLNKAAKELQAMKQELGNIREERDHPIRTAIQNAANSLENTINNAHSQLNEIKAKIIDGCKNAAAAFKQAGISALNGIVRFFKIKPALESLRGNLQNGINKNNKSIARIETISAEYHSIGRHLKNIGRVMRGKEPLVDIKPNGKLAKLIETPFRVEVICLSNALIETKRAIVSLDLLEKAAPKKAVTSESRESKTSALDHMKNLLAKIERDKRDAPVMDKSKRREAEI